jgi:hypothetical protein
MSKQQTAVEWLVYESMKILAQAMTGTLNEDTIENDVNRIVTKAKEMEKEQIIDSYRDGRSDQQSDRPSKFYNRMAEQYYNETFKQEQ